MGEPAPGEVIAKGPITFCLDQLSVHQDAVSLMNTLANAIADLSTRQFSGLENVFAQHLLEPIYGKKPYLIDKITQYLKDFWFDPNSKSLYFPRTNDVARIYGSGVQQTVKASLAKDKNHALPIDSWWLLGYPQFHMINLASSRQITLIVATPLPEVETPAGIWGEDAVAWTTDTNETRKFSGPRTRRPDAPPSA